MNIGKTKLNIHNRFDAVLYNNKGEVKQEAVAENIVLNQFWQSYASFWNDFDAMAIGTGTPTDGITMDPTRTTLFEQLGSHFLVEGKTSEEQIVNGVPTLVKTGTCTFPANSTYQGVVSEVGLGWNYSYYGTIRLYTHALFKDSEGNPITIAKSDTDILIIKYTIYFTTTSSFSDIITDAWPISEIYGGLEYKRIFLTGDFLANKNYSPTSAEISTTSTSDRTVDTAQRKVNFRQQRTPDTSGNYGLANWLIAEKLFAVKLPNADLFPPYELNFSKIGTGDGIKNTFIVPVPQFVQNTDVIKIGETILTRGVDYTINHNGNSAKSFSAAESSKEIIDSNSFFVGREATLLSGQNNMSFRNPISARGLYIGSNQASIFPLTIAYSEDGVAFTDIITVNTSAEFLAAGRFIDFGSTITAKHWRVTSSATSALGNAWLGSAPDQGVVFATPPASGQDILFKCTVDRPYKTSDYVFDISYSMGY